MWLARRSTQNATLTGGYAVGSGIVRAASDTAVNIAFPNMKFGPKKWLPVQLDAAYTYVYLRSPAPLGATITSATLRGTVRAGWTGTRTLTARPLAGSFTKARTTWALQPEVLSGQAASVTVGAKADGDMIEFNVTAAVQAVANGRQHFGWRIQSSSSTLVRFHASESGSDTAWELEVEWSDAPDKPTTLVPSSGAVSIAKPVLEFDYTDVSGSTELAAVQVQIDPLGAAGGTPDWDSGAVETLIPQLDLAGTSYPGLANNASTQWRVRVKDDAGLWSGWSDWAEFSRINKPTVTLDQPSSGIVYDSTPLIVATSSAYVAKFRILIYNAARTKVLYDSDEQPGDGGTEVRWQIPLRNDNRAIPRWGVPVILPDDTERWLQVRIWDDEDREATSGDPTWTSVETLFAIDDDLAVTPVSTLSVTQERGTPLVQFQWTRTAGADAWELLIDGKVADKWLSTDPDLMIVGNTFTINNYPGIDPWVEHEYNIRPVTNGQRGRKGPTARWTLELEGVWLIRTNGTFVQLRNVSLSDWAQEDRRLTFKPLNRHVDVDIITQLEGMSGTVSGTITEGHSPVAYDTAKTRLDAIKDNPTEAVTLVAADWQGAVRLRNLTVKPDDDFMAGQKRMRVEFEFFQVGALGYGVD